MTLRPAVWQATAAARSIAQNLSVRGLLLSAYLMMVAQRPPWCGSQGASILTSKTFLRMGL